MCNNPEITPMSKIARLTTSTSFQLEAEQVISDLSSAVKELVENSLDSNPRAINITFINYGFDSIIVEDDGDGISPINMQEIASCRYATSKIVDEGDLETSLSYGFRGEALHSLVKLSRKLTILSTSDDSGSGISKVFSDFGNKIDIFDKPRTKGTTICIEGLFECISIRRQDWFKRKSMIFSQVVFLLQSFSVLTANVKFSVYNVKDNNSKLLVLHCSGEDIASRFTECLKSDHKKIEELFESFDIQGEKCTIKGIFVKNSKDSKNRLVVFLNRKPFESPKWQKYFLQLLKKNFISGSEFFLSVALPGLWIDYNVTPDKKTIFILNEADILKKIVEICEISVRNNLVMETRDYGSYNNTKTSTPISIHNCEVHQPTTGCIDESIINIGSAHSVQLSKNDIAELIPIGQFNNGFIICSKISEKVTEIFAIDQHAADERIRFEEIANSYSISCQKLVHPIKLNISSEDEDLILNNFDMIRSTGFLIRKFENSCYLDALPNFYGAETNIEDFFELVSFIKDHGILYKNMCPKFQRVLASRACRSAIMIGSPLTTLQIQKILSKLSKTDYPWICAHGRPTIQFLKCMDLILE